MVKEYYQWKYKVLFGIILVISIRWPSFEILFGILILTSIYFLNQRKLTISSDFLTVILPLFVLLFFGSLITFFYSYSFINIAKDLAYFLKPILLLFIGYALILSINDARFLFKAFIYLSIVFSLIHIFRLIINPDLFPLIINKIRNIGGLSNDIELLALVFLLLSFKYPVLNIFKKKTTSYIVITLLAFSFFLYFSRTMWMALFLLVLTTFGYAKISFKAFKYIALVLILIGGFYIYLYSIEIDREEPGMSAFLYKMKIAPEEIFVPKIDLNNHADLWDHWRAYEAQMAIDQIHGYQLAVGKGFGSSVDLHFVAPLNEEGMRYISHLHNGYALIYYKTGILGLIFYLLFILNLYLFTFYKKNNFVEIPINNLIAAIGVYILFSTLIITGVYNLQDIYMFALGGFIALFNKFKLKNKLN